MEKTHISPTKECVGICNQQKVSCITVNQGKPNPGLPVHLPVPQMVDFQLSILAGKMNTAVAKMSTKMNWSSCDWYHGQGMPPKNIPGHIWIWSYLISYIYIYFLQFQTGTKKNHLCRETGKGLPICRRLSRQVQSFLVPQEWRERKNKQEIKKMGLALRPAYAAFALCFSGNTVQNWWMSLRISAARRLPVTSRCFLNERLEKPIPGKLNNFLVLKMNEG